MISRARHKVNSQGGLLRQECMLDVLKESLGRCVLSGSSAVCDVAGDNNENGAGLGEGGKGGGRHLPRLVENPVASGTDVDIAEVEDKNAHEFPPARRFSKLVTP